MSWSVTLAIFIISFGVLPLGKSTKSSHYNKSCGQLSICSWSGRTVHFLFSGTEAYPWSCLATPLMREPFPESLGRWRKKATNYVKLLLSLCLCLLNHYCTKSSLLIYHCWTKDICSNIGLPYQKQFSALYNACPRTNMDQQATDIQNRTKIESRFKLCWSYRRHRCFRPTQLPAGLHKGNLLSSSVFPVPLYLTWGQGNQSLFMPKKQYSISVTTGIVIKQITFLFCLQCHFLPLDGD